MNEKTLRLLEFDVIRARTAECALSEEAARRILDDFPRRTVEETDALNATVAAVLDRMYSGEPEKRDSLPAIGGLFPKLAVPGAALEIDEAYALGLFTERGEELRGWLSRGREQAGTGLLKAALEDAPECADIGRAVFRVLERDGSLRDLPVFQEINRRIRALSREIEGAVSGYAQREETRQILRSTVPSQRDGRTVLAVKANFRGRIKGIVHEVSATGQTVFIEPAEVVEKNNDMLVEKRRLDAEVLRVLRELTELVAGSRTRLAAFHGVIIELETFRARARYAFETQGRFAERAEAGRIRLRQARHPLLGSRAVPIDFTMDTRALIITGPNTGGKTVTLKTLGLFALMNQFGLALPAGDGTALPVFDGVYADIGDDQSLAQSLSTFSAHMTAIAAITRNATANSLALLDELGSGTDPQEGSALAMAILDYFIARGTRLLVTTHHGVLKNYGYTREQAENASVEFDAATLSPTYRIVTGIPGESRAFDIARRNGLDDGIIRQARAYADGDLADLSALITGLKRKHEALRGAEAAQKAEEARTREARRRTDLKELRVRQKEADLKARGVADVRGFLEESRKALENLVRELREGEVSKEKTRGVKDFIRGLEEGAARAEEALDAERRLLDEDLRRFEREHAEAEAAEESPTRPLAPGVEVLAGAYKQRGTVLRMEKKGAWLVEIGSVRMRFQEKELRPLAPSKTAPAPAIALPDLCLTPSVEVSLRGMRLEEALLALRRQFDAAVFSGLEVFSVIHGNGDGVLRRGVHEFLKSQPQVADYYLSRPETGGFGRTEVVLKPPVAPVTGKGKEAARPRNPAGPV
ncbi:MAG: Smr/MutS family protein [Spirochaetaceae bacterium]|jgi:DNA mismatch repair protein MutS2|nr:Smr/MutS family protein [Spirochaetaceae bacterium]